MATTDPLMGREADEARDNGHDPTRFVGIEGPYLKCLRCGLLGDDMAMPCPAAHTAPPDHIQHLARDWGKGTVCGAEPNWVAPDHAMVILCEECRKVAVGEMQTPEPELTEAESLGLLVGAALGKAMAERDQAVDHLRAIMAASPATSWAHANVSQEAAAAWLEEYDAAKTVGSPETPEQETPGP